MHAIQSHLRRRGRPAIIDLEMGAMPMSSKAAHTATTTYDNGLGLLNRMPPSAFVKTLSLLDVEGVNALRQTSQGARQAIDCAGPEFWRDFAESLGPIRLDASKLVARANRWDVPVTRIQCCLIGVAYGAVLMGASIWFINLVASTPEKCEQRTSKCFEHIVNATRIGTCLQAGRPHPGPGCDVWNMALNTSIWKDAEEAYQTCNFRARSYCEIAERGEGAFYFLFSCVAAVFATNLARSTAGVRDWLGRKVARHIPKPLVENDPLLLARGRLEQIRVLGGELKSAIDAGDERKVRRMIRCGFASAARFEGRYPLTQALNRHQYNMAKWFVSGGAIPRDPTLVSTAVHRSAPFPTLERILEAGATPTADAFRFAVDNDNVDVVEALRDASDDPASLLAKFNCRTLLRRVLVNNASFDVVRTLVEIGVPLNAQDGGNTTPLHLAVERERLDVVALLMRAGARADVRDELGYTALDLAGTHQSRFPFA